VLVSHFQFIMVATPARLKESSGSEAEKDASFQAALSLFNNARTAMPRRWDKS